MKTLFFLFVLAAMAALTLSSCETLEWDDPGLLVPLTVDQDPALPSIIVNGTQLHAETFGNPSDPMIVVLHGGPGGDYRGMLNCSKFSADSFFVVFYDQRGCGLSKRHDRESFSTQLFIDDLGAVIAHYRQPGQKVTLMGLSWGAMLATAYVNQHPGDVDGLVLMEPGGFTWPDAEAYIKRSRPAELLDEVTSDVVYLDQFVTGSDHAVLDYKAGIQGAAEYAAGNKSGNPGPSPFWRMGAVCASAAIDFARAHSFDFTANLQQFTPKVLFLYSERNEAYGRSHAEHVSSAYPNVELAQINGTGHEIPYFGWDGLYSIAKPYLKSVN